MQTALHISALTAQLKKELIGSEIISTEFYKKERSAYIFFKKQKEKFALGFVYHPAGFGTFLVPASKIKITTREKPWPIFKLEKAKVADIQQVESDRLIKIHLTINEKSQLLLVESIGPNGNLWLLGEDHKKISTLRKKEYQPGDKYDFGRNVKRLNPFLISEKELEKLLSSSEQNIVSLLEKNISGFNRSLAIESLKRAGIETRDSVDPGKLINSIRQIAELFMKAQTGYLYLLSKGLEAYPFKLSSVDMQPEKFKTLSIAIAEIVSRKQTVVEKADESKVITNAVKREIKKLVKRVGHVEKDIATARDYESYKKNGELIQINMNRLKKGMTEIELDDIISGADQKITIKLKQTLTPAENAEDYFKKYRKGKLGLELLKRRLEITIAELENWRVIDSDLEINYEKASKQYESEIFPLLPSMSATKNETQRLPYRAMQLSSGLTIFVGKDGSDNDRTTFDFAKPYELWFHTQQCPGSHVVMKFPNKSFVPSKSEIEETAAVAAFHSKARKNSMVAVIYTQRKYVRKPRKAKPGLVSVEREKSVMVAPGKPEQ